MKLVLFFYFLLLPVLCKAQPYLPKEGDIVFQTSRSTQSAAVQAATASPYSHMGIILFQKGKPYVFEAVQPVKFTELGQWLARGKAGHFVAKRLKSSLNATEVGKLHVYARRYVGKPYDLTFEWSDERIYCSELVWKLYKQAANVELAPLEKLGSFNLKAPVVRKKLTERYGANIPLKEPVISPVAIFNSPLLLTIAKHGVAPRIQ